MLHKEFFFLKAFMSLCVLYVYIHPHGSYTYIKKDGTPLRLRYATLHDAFDAFGPLKHLLQRREAAVAKVLLALPQGRLLGDDGGAVDGPLVAHDGLHGVDLIVVQVGGDVVPDFLRGGVRFWDGAVCDGGEKRWAFVSWLPGGKRKGVGRGLFGGRKRVV